MLLVSPACVLFQMLHRNTKLYCRISVCTYKLVMLQLNYISLSFCDCLRHLDKFTRFVRKKYRYRKILSRWINPCCTIDDIVITSILRRLIHRLPFSLCSQAASMPLLTKDLNFQRSSYDSLPCQEMRRSIHHLLQEERRLHFP